MVAHCSAEQLDPFAWVQLAQTVAHVLRLPQGKRAFAGGNDPGRHGKTGSWQTGRIVAWQRPRLGPGTAQGPAPRYGGGRLRQRSQVFCTLIAGIFSDMSLAFSAIRTATLRAIAL